MSIILYFKLLRVCCLLQVYDVATGKLHHISSSLGTKQKGF